MSDQIRELLAKANISTEKLVYRAPPVLKKDSWVELHYFAGKTPLIVLTDLIDSGVSVTNAAEYAFVEAIKYIETQLPEPLPQNILLVEHYDERSFYAPEDNQENFSLVKLNSQSSPKWEHIPVPIMVALLQEITNTQVKPEKRIIDNTAAIAVLDSFVTEGDAEEQKETWAFLEDALNLKDDDQS